ncbi:hypothetical protein ACROYT_G013562 [Oculina patagonica]
MILRTILPLVLGLVFITISEAENSTVTDINGTAKCAPVTQQVPLAKCSPYQGTFPNGYCKDIIGYLPVYGSYQDLHESETKLRNYQMAKNFLLKTRQQRGINGIYFSVRQSCLDMVDDVYCHHYFKHCNISSKPQFICRETCNKLLFEVCDREIKLVKTFAEEEPSIFMEIINCRTLPFRNESSNCYYPDKIRDKLNILESQECFYGDGRGYRGNKSFTVSGHTCQSWDAECPHKHNINGTIYKEMSGNLCRNPGGYALDGPWCFTSNRTIRWESCDVPKCPERPSSRPPANFRGHSGSSTSIKLTWGDVPKDHIHGVLLGFHVACERMGNVSDRHFENLGPTENNWTFQGLQKYKNYSCQLRAHNNYGNGAWSEELVISTDEDVPDRPPTNITTHSLATDVIQVSWKPVPSEYTNGKVLGYNVLYKEIDDLSPANSSLVSPEETHLKIKGLKANTNYSFQVLAFTAKGNGAKSKAYFAKPLSGKTGWMPKPDPSSGKAQSGKVSMAVLAVLSGTVALGTVVFAIYFVRKRRTSLNVNNESGLNYPLAPYAISSPAWVERIGTTDSQGYDMPDTVPTTTRQPRYINIAADGSLDLPPHLRNIINEFEQLYENTRYKTLQRHGRRRSVGGAVDGRGNSVYDRLQKGIIPIATCQANRCSQEVQRTVTSAKEHKLKKCHSVDLGELRPFVGVLHGEKRSMEATEVPGTLAHRSRRRFSVDLGHLREFIALREMKVSTKEESSNLADQTRSKGSRCKEPANEILG